MVHFHPVIYVSLVDGLFVAVVGSQKSAIVRYKPASGTTPDFTIASPEQLIGTEFRDAFSFNSKSWVSWRETENLCICAQGASQSTLLLKPQCYDGLSMAWINMHDAPLTVRQVGLSWFIFVVFVLSGLSSTYIYVCHGRLLVLGTQL